MKPIPLLTARLIGAALLLGLAACGGDNGVKSARPAAVYAAQANIDQDSLCAVNVFKRQDVMKTGCKAGQKIAFLPDSWGNEQLPIMFAAVNCDMRYQIALTHGGVACIYRPMQDAPAAAESASAPAK